MLSGIGSFAVALLKWAPIAFKGVKEAKDMIDWGIEVIDKARGEDRDISGAEWDQLNEKISELEARLDAAAGRPRPGDADEPGTSD